ncbi:MAG: hypothetical protein JEZ11_04210 [Desulfobacterales bacterium]|nr:hypothetical protein [Desulfobacterales bacterium]
MLPILTSEPNWGRSPVESWGAHRSNDWWWRAGDTSGKIQELLQIQAIQVATPIGIGAPLCYVYSNQPEINGLEVAFKGGQVGSENYFDRIRRAKTAAFETVALGEI